MKTAMKKIGLLIFATVAVCLLVTAQPLTQEEARQKALHFLNNATGGSRRSAAHQLQLTPAGIVHDLYVFNIDDNDGYVIASNDERTTPILGYSKSGKFDMQHMPDNMRAWLQGYADEIAWLQKQDEGQNPALSAPGELPTLRRAAKSEIAPLLKTTWSQEHPYNKLLPLYDASHRCVTGCVATAMAQVMNYHQWPAATTQEIPAYTTTTLGIEMDSIPAGTPIKWEDIADSDVYLKTDLRDQALAELMLYCGTAVKMDYGQSSGAFTTSAAAALRNYFGYKTTTKCISRSNYTYGKWVDIIYHELQEGRPVIYGGVASSLSGHEFVCDGYDAEDYFHMNWGWAGMCDGYFKLSVLDPYDKRATIGSSPNAFFFMQEAIVGIQKPADSGTVLDIQPTAPRLAMDVADIVVSDNPTQYNNVEIQAVVKNNNDTDYDGGLYMYYRELGGPYGADMKMTVIPANGSKTCSFSFTPTQSRTYNLSFWDASDNYLAGIEVDVLPNENFTETTDDVELEWNCHVENADEGMTNFYGNVLKGTITYTNRSAKNYKGRVGYYNVTHSGGSAVSSESVMQACTIEAGQSLDIPFEWQNLDYGNDYVVVSAYRRAGAYKYNGTSRLTIHPAFTEYNPDGTVTVVKPLSTSYTAPTEAVAVNLMGTGVTTVVPSSNPNCLYILGSDDDMPAGIADRNVVVYDGSGYTAEKLTLTDGCDFRSPVVFTAANSEFRYAFTKGADGSKGWNTLMVPFDVEKVTADGTEIDWFRSSEDTGKQFWVKEFDGDEGQNVLFKYAADGIKANKPYIIALPGNRWGSRYDLSGKTIKLVGPDNAEIAADKVRTAVMGSNYRFVGSMVTDATESIYALDSDGSSFVLSNAGSKPFRAYFKPDIFDSTVGQLMMTDSPEMGGDITAISDIEAAQQPTAAGCYYNLSGQRVAQPQQGLYILGGRKVVVR